MVIFFTIADASIHALCEALLFKKSMVIFFTIAQPSIYALSEQMVILITIAILPFCAPFLALCSPASMRLLSNGNCHYHFFRAMVIAFTIFRRGTLSTNSVFTELLSYSSVEHFLVSPLLRCSVWMPVRCSDNKTICRLAIQVLGQFGHSGTRAFGHSDTWALGHLDTRTLGHSGTWTLGHLGTRHSPFGHSSLSHSEAQPIRHSANQPFRRSETPHLEPLRIRTTPHSSIRLFVYSPIRLFAHSTKEALDQWLVKNFTIY